jgi:MFS family permease
MDFRKLLPVIFIVVATVFCVAPIRNHLRKGSTKDYPLWYETGQRVVHGQSAYYKDRNGEFPFMYPPAAAALLAPASALGKLPLMILLVAINTFAWLVCILAPIYLVSSTIRGQDPLLYWLPSVCCIFYIWSTYLLGGPALVLAASIVGMLVCLRRRIFWAAGLLVAFAAGFKAFPILALPYLIYRRYWKALAYTLVFLALMLIALPAYYRGFSGALKDLEVWRKDTGTYDSSVIGQRKERSFTWQNGSIIAEAHRLLRPVIADHDDNYVGEPPITVNIASLSFRQINIVIVAAGLVLCLGYIAVMPRQTRRTHWTDAIEGAMLMILIITFTPLSFTYNNSWLMLPIVVVCYFILAVAKTIYERRLAVIWLALSLGLLIFTTGKPLFFRFPRAMGNTFWCCMSLYGELAWIMIKARRNSPINRASREPSGSAAGSAASADQSLLTQTGAG